MKVRSVLVRSRLRLRGIVLLCLAAGLLSSTAHDGLAADPMLRLDPQKVKGPDACGECHKSSVAAWKDSHHATTFKTLPQSDKAKKIAEKMGIRRIKSESDCLTCHFTSAIPKDETDVKPIAGITCESCHGAGADWIDVHSKYGGKGVTMETETAEHKTERYAKSEAAGMIRPVRLYDVANNCFGCHTVPNEKLVNVGGHPAGSKFDLVAWSQGEVRHNVQYTKENNEASVERRRMMYILGTALDLEHALRGVAKATEKAKYAVAMAKRAKAAQEALAKIAEAVKTPEIEAMIAAAGSARLKLNNGEALTAAADKVGEAARKFAESYDGAAFAGVDALVPGPEEYKGKVAQ